MIVDGGGPLKILFVCSRNKWRSLTAEKIFAGTPGYEVRSAGTEEQARVKITSGHVGWADVIFAMEKKHVRRIKEKYHDSLSNKKLICLDIPDDYRFMDEELIEILKSRVSDYLDLEE
ncbi:protein tyrosine phosphatase [Paenibacillus alba]|uniref:low molecular weight protein tyrosine phosphatase family protein n=1 Tax=Paenibacillus alba TaxID=1197127 RepID=UPI001565A907|nr:protein tyrosine phosphatase [Paenibacillus alba]NQX71299.1 protein tyrosine phosphatase [Paenibacillus alba]